MPMHNPPHPGEFIREVYIEPFGLSARQLAAKLAVSPSTLNRVLNGTAGVSPEMALRLSKGLGRSPESWLALQGQHDLWIARQTVDLAAVEDRSGSTRPDLATLDPFAAQVPLFQCGEPTRDHCPRGTLTVARRLPEGGGIRQEHQPGPVQCPPDRRGQRTGSAPTPAPDPGRPTRSTA